MSRMRKINSREHSTARLRLTWSTVRRFYPLNLNFTSLGTNSTRPTTVTDERRAKLSACETNQTHKQQATRKDEPVRVAHRGQRRKQDLSAQVK